MFGLGPMELILILLIVIVLFGAKRLPAIGEGLAKGISSFRANISSIGGDNKNDAKDDTKDEPKEHTSH